MGGNGGNGDFAPEMTPFAPENMPFAPEIRPHSPIPVLATGECIPIPPLGECPGKGMTSLRRPRGGGARHAERGVRPAGRGHLRHLSRARHSPPRPKARGQVLLRPSLRPPHSDRCAPLAGPPGGEGAQIAVGRGDSWRRRRQRCPGSRSGTDQAQIY